MIVFQGSVFIVDTPRIIRTEFFRDFWIGFYTTDIEEQAVRWALRKQKLESRKNEKVKAYMNIYEYDKEDAEKNLHILHFIEPQFFQK